MCIKCIHTSYTIYTLVGVPTGYNLSATFFYERVEGEQGERERKVRRYVYVYYVAPFHKDFSARGHPGTSCLSECSVGWNAWDEIHCRENGSKPLLLRLVISHHVFTIFTRFKPIQTLWVCIVPKVGHCLSIWCIAKTRPFKILAFEEQTEITKEIQPS